MRLFLVIAVLLIFVGSGFGQSEGRTVIDPEGTADFVETRNDHRAKLAFTTRLFELARHRISHRKSCVIIDGRRPLGTDCGLPKVEISSMKLFWDGRQIAIPRRLYSDCYSPPYFKDYKKRGWMKNYLSIRFSDDMKAVFVFLHAGDGAGVYDVVWVFRKDGNHSRFTDSGGDCSFLNFDCRGN